MNSEFMTAWRGEGGRRIYSAGTKALVGDQQPVLNITQWHRVNVPTGAFALVTWRHRVIARPSAFVRSLGNQPVPIPPSAFGTGWWHHPVPILVFWYQKASL